MNFLLPVAPADTASTTSKQASHVVDVKEPKKKKKKVGCLGNYYVEGTEFGGALGAIWRRQDRSTAEDNIRWSFILFPDPSGIPLNI